MATVKQLKAQYGLDTTAEVYLTEFGYGVRICDRDGKPRARLVGPDDFELWRNRRTAQRVADGYNQPAEYGLYVGLHPPVRITG